jgi:hypothetical protein
LAEIIVDVQTVWLDGGYGLLRSSQTNPVRLTIKHFLMFCCIGPLFRKRKISATLSAAGCHLPYPRSSLTSFLTYEPDFPTMKPRPILAV